MRDFSVNQWLYFKDVAEGTLEPSGGSRCEPWTTEESVVNGVRKWIGRRIIAWLTGERDGAGHQLSDFERLCDEIRPCDILLVEGRSPISEIIKTITQSPWSHAAIYIGRLRDIDVPAVRTRLAQHTNAGPDTQLIIEAILGHGTIVTPLERYQDYSVRLCRPAGLSLQDRQRVVAFVAEHLGTDYDLRQLLDLARFMFPYGVLPRRWRSSLFVHNAGPETRIVCSTLLANAFQAVSFPILPVLTMAEAGEARLYNRNTRLFTPRDFDSSPYFEIRKFPCHSFDELTAYHRLPWDQRGIICNSENDCYVPLITQTDPGENIEQGAETAPTHGRLRQRVQRLLGHHRQEEAHT
jgi:hypothetical protein